MAIHNLKVLIIFLVINFLVLKIYAKAKGPKFYFNPKTPFVAFFLYLICFPFFQEKTNIFRYQSVEENRKKISHPLGNPIVELLNTKNNYSSAYEKYFNDNYGLRDLFIRLKNQIDYSAFGVSDEIIIGKNHWLFYKNVVEREQFYLEQQTEAQFENIQNKILSLNQYFKKREVLFVVMPIPMKNSVYPEHYTNRTTNRPSPTKFERFITFLKSHPEVAFIDAPAILQQYKNQYQLFHKTDFHWNDTAAFLVSQETISSINKWTNRSVRWQYPLKTQNDTDFTGGQTNSLAILISPKENILRISNSPKSAIPDPITPLPFLYYFKSPVSSQNLFPKMLLIGNSYLLNFLNTGIFDHFSETLIIHSNDMQKIPTAVPKDVKIVIWEMIEVDLLKESLFKINY
ncbi:MAG: hypothetical protein WC841_01700 [Candidatus Shapirobacteria bacterium]|jgi:hypothetical protein